jgi:hypothetical protein
MDASKDKELVANGLVCINLAFKQVAVLNKTISEFSDFKSRVADITSLYAEE